MRSALGVCDGIITTETAGTKHKLYNHDPEFVPLHRMKKELREKLPFSAFTRHKMVVKCRRLVKQQVQYMNRKIVTRKNCIVNLYEKKNKIYQLLM